jgi:hypothetical protein
MRFCQFSEESKSFEKDLKTWLLDNNLPVSKCCSAYLLKYNHPSLGQPDGYGICDNCNKMSEAINYMDLDEGAMEDAERVIQKTFSPERKAVQAEVLRLARAVEMGKDDKIMLARAITELTKSELEVKRSDPDLKVSTEQNLNILKRAMDKLTGVTESVGEIAELTETEVVKIIRSKRGLGSLRNRSAYDGLSKIKNIELDKKDAPKKAVGESLTEAEFDEAAGEKDACYRKVKSRYKVWPSAYASGALVKCRKVGAANWGNSKKK